MNNSIRVSAKTVDDAITEAIIQLGVTSDRLEYEVIEKGSSGFLGIGMKQAVIEARRKPEPEPEPILEKILKKEEKKPEAVKPVKSVDTDKVKVEKVEAKVEADVEIKTEAKADNEPVVISDEAKAEVEKFLKDTLKAMGMEVELTSSVDKDSTLCVDMAGNNMGILIGKRGQTLDSLQYLANRVANKYNEDYIRVKLDTENYRSRREETLKRLAKNLAHKVKRTRRPVSLEPMNPYERRIIHSVLQADPYVSTHSEGEEPFRKVVITLKR